ncbi:hypothetical protein SAMN05216185_10947 [Pseudomonas guariconensis]|uniref:Uncharacterized protein n=1 Tax=Pseudomonas putida TaxID=303 RepID=A0A6S5T801_PSEPU|nr:hypothetical protein WP8W18C01_19490 [Pseudomonas putida]CAB5713730.1 Uncharacterised protein [Pseudomonas putida]SDD53127.1 hypothetical protein SAMN05216185_10947 [Pseudomonas guariconensis]
MTVDAFERLGAAEMLFAIGKCQRPTARHR